jgi:hypothetical protein
MADQRRSRFLRSRQGARVEDRENFTSEDGGGLTCTLLVFLSNRVKAMFEDDPGDEEIRATVEGWKVWR